MPALLGHAATDAGAFPKSWGMPYSFAIQIEGVFINGIPDNNGKKPVDESSVCWLALPRFR